MTLSLTALMAHPELADLRLLAGDPDRDVIRIVGIWTTPVGRTSVADAVLGDALLVLDSAPAAGWQLDSLLRRAATSGAAALILPADARHSGLDVGTSLLADRLGIAVISCVNPWYTGTIIRDLLSGADHIIARSAIAAAHVGQRAGVGPEELLTALADRYGRQVLLLDSAGHVLATSGFVPGTEDLKPLAELSASTNAISLALAGGRHLVGRSVRTGVGRSYWLAAVLETLLPTEAEAISVALDVASVAMGHRLALIRMSDERDARHRISLLGDLMEAAGDISAPLLRRSLDSGWNLEGWHIGIRMTVRADIDLVAGRVDVIAGFAAESLTAEVVEQADGWAAWLTSANEPTPTSVERISRSLRRVQRALDPSFPMQVGVGRAHSGPSGLNRSLTEAADAARLAGTRPQTGRFLHVDRLGLAQLLLAWTRNDTFEPAANELLLPLREAGGDLLRTLTTYLDAESSMVETAAVLGVHRNTVSDRISRVQRLLAVDLSDPETRLALHLACRTMPQ